MQLTSSAFKQGGSIPQRFTCEGQNISPDFSWRDAPKETKSFVLLIHDPDAPRKDGFAHWVLYNIPHGVDHIPEESPHKGTVEGMGLQGKNDSNKLGYTGPCPPTGKHRYFCRLYALKQKLDLQPGASYKEVIAAMEGTIIEEAELMGTYVKQGQKAA